MNSIGGVIVAFLAVLVLASCAVRPVETIEPAPASSGFVLQPAPYQNFEAARRDKALELAQQERWTEVAIEWEILTLLRPENPEYRTRLQDAKSRVAKGVEQYLTSAQNARDRGDAQQAVLLYLKTLTLDPTNSTAITALQALEQEAQQRKLHSRVARVALYKDPGSVRTTEHRDLEFGVLLFHQGDYAGSIRTLARYVKAAPKDELGRRYLSDAYLQLAQQRMEQGKSEEALSSLESAQGLHEQQPPELKAKIESVRKLIAEDYYRRGMKVYRTDLNQAIVFWERSLQYDPLHSQARVRLQQARQMQRNLKVIDGDNSQH